MVADLGGRHGDEVGDLVAGELDVHQLGIVGAVFVGCAHFGVGGRGGGACCAGQHAQTERQENEDAQNSLFHLFPSLFYRGPRPMTAEKSSDCTDSALYKTNIVIYYFTKTNLWNAINWDKF